MSGTIKTHKYQ